MKKLYVLFLLIAVCFLLFFINTLVGNPINKSLATSYAKQFMTTQFDNYTIEFIGFNRDTKMYEYLIQHDNENETYNYSLTVNSTLSNRTIDSFTLHPSLLDEDLSERLSKEGELHVTNIVHRILHSADVTYKVYVPVGQFDDTVVWQPGFTLDLNGVIEINDEEENWHTSKYDEISSLLKEELASNGVYYSKISIRITNESTKNGITYIKTVFHDEIYPNEG